MLTRSRNRPAMTSPFDLLAETLSGSFPGSFFSDFGLPTVVAVAPGAGEQGTPSVLRLALDISEKDHVIEVKASLPGFRKEDVHVAVDDGVLTITAAHAETTEGDTKESGVTWHRRERRVANFTRSIRLPEGTTGEGVTAELKEGVLVVRIPNPPRKPAVAGRRIEIA